MAVDATMPTTVVSAPGTGSATSNNDRFDGDDGDRG